MTDAMVYHFLCTNTIQSHEETCHHSLSGSSAGYLPENCVKSPGSKVPTVYPLAPCYLRCLWFRKFLLPQVSSSVLLSSSDSISKGDLR